MKRILCLTLCFLMTVSLLAACGGGGVGSGENTEKGHFSVGYGVGDISPTEPMMLRGFGDQTERYHTSVSERLLTTCIAITGEDGETVLVLANDLLKAEPDWTDPVREAISKETGIPFDKIMFHTSHTHSAPYVRKYPAYQAQIREQAVLAAKQALEDRAPATMQGSYTRVEEKVSCNRHYLLADGTYMGEGVGSVPKNQLIGHYDLPDNLLQVVKFERGEKKDIVLMNWQAHYLGSVLDYTAVTSDYPGVMRTTVEQALDCHALFFLSASGNLNSWSQFPNELEFEYHTDLGKFLGNKVVSMMEQMKPMNTGKVQITKVMQPCRTLSVKGMTEEIPIYALAFGDVSMIFAPYEMFDTNAMAVRDQSPFPMTFVASCSNEGHSYIPTPDSWDWEQHYEVRVTTYEKGTAEELQDKFVEMLNGLFTDGGYTAVEKGEGYVTPEFVPTSDGLTYTNPDSGNLNACEEVANGFYRIQLLNQNNKPQLMLCIDKATAEEVLKLSTMKLLFNQSHVIVGIEQ